MIQRERTELKLVGLKAAKEINFLFADLCPMCTFLIKPILPYHHHVHQLSSLQPSPAGSFRNLKGLAAHHFNYRQIRLQLIFLLSILKVFVVILNYFCYCQNLKQKLHHLRSMHFETPVNDLRLLYLFSHKCILLDIALPF